MENVYLYSFSTRASNHKRGFKRSWSEAAREIRRDGQISRRRREEEKEEEEEEGPRSCVLDSVAVVVVDVVVACASTTVDFSDSFALEKKNLSLG
ncbi:hypothetical protein KOW79_018572 [Hemibagrus wyckioides]|uniref:Uncharacterized protein n=1 Tax=Hemibagrus wyckioides TaxID=337641 RepID=A0A9D3NAU9_9TELE|nr:hypothetical protein KOW79_018572 [Hemibagrus wyckioides]